MRINAKGQVTIPVEIREKLGLLPNTEVKFEVVGEAVKMRKARRGEGVRAAAGSRSSGDCVAADPFG
jgi:AbrB family looped-hinge helix DNA binding protein